MAYKGDEAGPDRYFVSRGVTAREAEYLLKLSRLRENSVSTSHMFQGQRFVHPSKERFEYKCVLLPISSKWELFKLGWTYAIEKAQTTHDIPGSCGLYYISNSNYGLMSELGQNDWFSTSVAG